MAYLIEAPTSAWRRAGLMLERQRVILDVRYRNRALFCRERKVHERLAQDLENAVRTAYRASTLAYVALAYGLEPGAIEAELDRHEGVPA